MFLLLLSNYQYMFDMQLKKTTKKQLVTIITLFGVDSATEGSSMFELLKCGLVVLGCLFLHRPFTVHKTHRTKLL